jgi:GTP cyclohydrolase FolE2
VVKKGALGYVIKRVGIVAMEKVVALEMKEWRVSLSVTARMTVHLPGC